MRQIVREILYENLTHAQWNRYKLSQRLTSVPHTSYDVIKATKKYKTFSFIKATLFFSLEKADCFSFQKTRVFTYELSQMNSKCKRVVFKKKTRFCPEESPDFL